VIADHVTAEQDLCRSRREDVYVYRCTESTSPLSFSK
jgi:hypothetical protein